MEAKVKVGDYVTWGSKHNARQVTMIGEYTLYLGGNGFILADGSTYTCGTTSIRKDLPDIEVVQHPSSISPDVVNKPSHYARFAIEPIEFILKNDLPFHKGNPIKYIARAGYKLYPEMDAEQSEVTDLKKAKRMIEMRLNQLAGEETL